MSFNENQQLELDNTCNVLSLCENDSLINNGQSNDSNNSEINAKEKEESVVKRSKNTHPLWSKLRRSADRKHVHCTLCEAHYGNKTGISTIKRHFETNHIEEYIQL